MEGKLAILAQIREAAGQEVSAGAPQSGPHIPMHADSASVMHCAQAAKIPDISTEDQVGR